MRRGAAVLVLLLAGPAAAEEPCQIVVPSANPATQIQREAVVAIYTGQMTRWKDGRPIAPVDQSTRSPVRAAFSEKILKQSVLAIQTHWNRQLMAGRGMPPPVKASDEEVVAFVRANAGAIGYVSTGFALPEGVKAVKISE